MEPDQAIVQVLNGTVVVHQLPYTDGTYYTYQSVRLQGVPDYPGSQVTWFAVDGQSGAIATVNMHADRFPVVSISFPPGVTATPTPTPQPAQIAFQSDRGTNWEIYLMYPDGSSQRKQTRTTDDAQSPTWSSDGSQIAFDSDRDDNKEIYVISESGAGAINLTNRGGSDQWPDWAPDGNMIAFTSDRIGNREIYLMNTDGTGVTRLTDNPAIDWTPSWSDDGTPLGSRMEARLLSHPIEMATSKFTL